MRWSGLAVVLAAFAGAAAAQTVTFEEADTDGDGALSQEELSAAFGADLVSRILDAEDGNGDGMLSRDEAEAALAEDAVWRDEGAEEVVE